MIFHDVEQNTPDWFRLRMAIPTASNFSRIITPAKGELSKSETSDLYLCELLASWAMDRPITGPETDFMSQGHEMEDEAVAEYELKGHETDCGGFFTTDDGWVGCSPDRRVGADKLLEIKSHPGNPGIHVRFMMGAELDLKYRPQLQGALWVAERQSVDIISYHPELPPVILTVQRDEEYIGKIEYAMSGFVSRMLAARVNLDREFGIEQRIVELRKRREEQPDNPALGVTMEDVGPIWDHIQKGVEEL
jgi:hypothetical protein